MDEPNRYPQRADELFATAGDRSSIERWCLTNEISPDILAKLLGAKIGEFVTSKQPGRLPHESAEQVAEVLAVLEALIDLVADVAALEHWLNTPNPAFGGEAPASLIRNRKTYRIWQMIEQLRLGTCA